MLPYHDESRAVLPIAASVLFAYLDDHARLAAHMSKSSWRMGGGRMSIELDEAGGHRVGSRIRMAGRVLGISLALEEAVTEYEVPHRKVWETIGQPRLLVVGGYRMGFEISPQPHGSQLRVFIDYDLPRATPVRGLTALLARYYARWCTSQMVTDAVKHFSTADLPLEVQM